MGRDEPEPVERVSASTSRAEPRRFPAMLRFLGASEWLALASDAFVGFAHRPLLVH